MPTDRMLNKHETASVLGVSLSTIRNLREAGELKGRTMKDDHGRDAVFFRESAVKKLAEERAEVRAPAVRSDVMKVRLARLEAENQQLRERLARAESQVDQLLGE